MDPKKRLIFFSSILGVLILVGLYVVAVEHLGSYTVTTTGETDNLANWTKLDVASDVFNFTIPFSVGMVNNITEVYITINDEGGVFDSTNLSNASVLVYGNGSAVYDTDSADHYTCGAVDDSNESINIWLCRNGTVTPVFVAGATLYFESNLTVNGSAQTTIGTDNATQIQINITTLDQGTVWNESFLYMGIDHGAPIIYDINVTDGNKTLMNGTAGLTNLSYTLARTQTVNLSDSDLTVTVIVQDPNIKNLTLLYTGHDQELMAASAHGNSTYRNGTAVAMTQSAVAHIGGDSGNLSDINIINTHVLFTGTIPASGITAGNITTFVFVTSDHYGQERIVNDTLYDDTNSEFAVSIAHASAMVDFESINVTDYDAYRDSDSNRNYVLDGTGLDGSGDFLRAELNEFQVTLKNLDYSNGTYVGLFYNTNGTGVRLDSNGTVTMYDNAPVLFYTISATNGTTGVFNASVDFTGNDTNVISFAVLIKNGEHIRTVGPYNYTVDATAPGEPTLTVPTDTSISVGSSTGITYSCSASDATSGGLTYSWILTKPGGTTVTKTGSSATFSGTELNEAGNYIVKCTATDAVGFTSEHLSTSDEDFVTTHSTSSSSGGGGGGSSSAAGVSFDVDFTTATEGTVSIAQGSTRTFTFDGLTSHTLKVDEIVDETTAKITIKSIPETLTLSIGESGKVDINEDGIKDVEVTLNSITNSVADFTITKIEEGAQIVAAEEIAAAAPEGPGEVPPTEEITPPTDKKGVGASAWIAIVIILIVVIVGYFLIRKKK